MDKKRWLYLPVEIKVRELDAKLLLAYYAAKKGYEVVIGDHIMVELASDIYPEGIFFSKGYPHGFRKRVITRANANRHKIVELDEEGLLIKGKQYLQDRMRKDMLELVVQEYCWGEFQHRIITKGYPDLAEKCHITGNPRFDLLAPKFRRLYQKESEQVIEKYGDFVLINTRFSRYNSAKGKKDNVHFKHIKKLYFSFLELVGEVSTQYPETNFVIRPHPGESFQAYSKAFSTNKNVHVIHEGNIAKWLAAAKVVIHNGCTSGIEASLLGRTLISYVPFPPNKREVNLPNQLGIMASTKEAVCSILEEALVYKDTDQSKNDLVRYCHWYEGKYAHEAIIDLCNQIPLYKPSRKEPTGNVKKGYAKKRKRIFSLTKEEISQFYRKLDEVEGGSGTVVKELGENLYRISYT
ncbi:surface carbohydrate biosynthesis protein [Sediminibacillus massiliensis]|uniref:surface carbohydrate biosynthesis protein n=1 Tax=Sediminibacillus massiliensis TaxID=1926277 RepID=UPI00098839E8|nr:surface carbohydrate biosynthesis protein [Sediminibacillus massiliensis]